MGKEYRVTIQFKFFLKCFTAARPSAGAIMVCIDWLCNISEHFQCCRLFTFRTRTIRTKWHMAYGKSVLLSWDIYLIDKQDSTETYLYHSSNIQLLTLTIFMKSNPLLILLSFVWTFTVFTFINYHSVVVLFVYGGGPPFPCWI